MYRWFLALRWLLSRPINLLGLLGVMLGVWALIVVVSIFSGYLREVRSHIRAVTADLSVLGLPEDVAFERIEPLVTRDPNVRACAPRLVYYGLQHTPAAGGDDGAALARAARGAAGRKRLPGPDSPFVSLVGIDAQREALVSSIGDWLQAVPTAFRPIDPDRPLAARATDQDVLPSILLGERRLRLQAGVSDRLESTSPHAPTTVVTTARFDAGEFTNGRRLQVPEGRRLAVAGAYSTEHASFDDFHCFLAIGALRELVGAPPTAVTSIAIRLYDDAAAEAAATARRLERSLNDELRSVGRPIRVRGWEQLHAGELGSVEHQRSLMKLVLFVIMVVAAVLMFATLLMMVTEKRRDIGILAAMGATRTGIAQVFASCGLAIVVCGAALGVVIGCLTAVYLDAINQTMKRWFDVDLFPTHIYNLKHVPYELDPVWIAQVVGVALVVGLVVAGVPAWLASRHDPVDSLRTD